jgi:hypothetical protein
MDAEKADNLIKVKAFCTSCQGSAKTGNRYLLISIPQTVGFRLESKDKLTFGKGFTD